MQGINIKTQVKKKQKTPRSTLDEDAGRECLKVVGSLIVKFTFIQNQSSITD